jgi:hypothetical protein
MERSKFLKTFGVGLGVAALTPQLLKAEVKTNQHKEDVKLAIDVAAICNITYGGNKLRPAEIIQIYNQTGFFLYNSNHGNPPVVISGEVEVIDVARR